MDSTFLLAALTIIVGAIVFMMRSIFASKCIRFQLGYGCIDVVRDVDMEMQDIRQTPQREIIGNRSRCNTPTDLAIDIENEKI